MQVAPLRRWAVPANLIPLTAFLVAFVALPVRALGGFSFLPGDLGDSRLNAYFLENIYQFLVGGSRSLWDLGMFAPYPYTLGFSDNLFGAAPAYLLPRLLTGSVETSLIVWWYIGWIANFVAGYLALRKLSLERIGATVGALVFAFGLPVSNFAFNWVQLDYRFGLPLAVAAWVVFLQRKQWPQAVAAVGWAVWQFWCSVYMGVFTLTVLLCITVAHVIVALAHSGPKGVVTGFSEYRSNLVRLGTRRAVVLGAWLVALGASMVLLLWPYLQVTRQYGFVRTYAEMFPMLPTLRSYLLSDKSWWWSGMSSQVTLEGLRHEHQLFPGLALILLTLVGIAVGVRRKPDRTFVTMLLGLVAISLLTLAYDGHSLWSFMAELPGFSAIRAVGRIVLGVLFLSGWIAGYGADALFAMGKERWRVVLIVLVSVLVLESSSVSPVRAPAADWRSHDATVDARIPEYLPPDAILFIAQAPGRPWVAEADASWAALRARRQTLNGYSGLSPDGFNFVFGTACAELPRRVLSYLKFAGESGDAAAYRSLMARVVPVGFTDCDPTWWTQPRAITMSTTDLTAGQLAAIKLINASASIANEYPSGTVTVTNTMTTSLAANATHPVRIAWRYLAADGTPLGGFDGRASLPFDLEPGASVNVGLPMDPAQSVLGGSIELTLFQEGLMRALDVGIPSLTIKIKG